MAKHDAIIIGTGQAGPSLAGRLAAAGMDVAIIERKLFGGTCVGKEPAQDRIPPFAPLADSRIIRKDASKRRACREQRFEVAFDEIFAIGLDWQKHEDRRRVIRAMVADHDDNKTV